MQLTGSGSQRALHQLSLLLTANSYHMHRKVVAWAVSSHLRGLYAIMWYQRLAKRISSGHILCQLLPVSASAPGKPPD